MATYDPASSSREAPAPATASASLPRAASAAQLAAFVGVAFRTTVFALTFCLTLAVALAIASSLFPPVLAFVAWLAVGARLSVRVAGYAACYPMVRHMRRASWPRLATNLSFTQAFINTPASAWSRLPPYEEIVMIPGLADHATNLPEDDFRRHYFATSPVAGRLNAVLQMLQHMERARQGGNGASPFPDPPARPPAPSPSPGRPTPHEP